MAIRAGTLETLDITQHFWRDKRVFITGHTGFKGSWLSLWLQQLGATVMGYSLPLLPSNPCLFETARVGVGMASLQGDILDLAALQTAIDKFSPDIVFHLAAQSLVKQSYADPIQTYATNVMGTAHLLETIRQTESVQVVVVVTSDKCYDNKEWIWGYRESDPMGGHDPYSSSKGCAELLTAAYRRSFLGAAAGGERCTAVATVRSGNVIGGGDWSKDRLVPDLLRAFACEESAFIRHPEAVRPWQHVLDPLYGYLLLAETMYREPEKYSSAWNFGPTAVSAQPVAWIADRLAALWGQGASWTSDPMLHPHEATYLQVDSSKAWNQIGWRPRLHLAEALTWIVDWTQAYRTGKDMHDFTNQQIIQFMELSPL